MANKPSLQDRLALLDAHDQQRAGMIREIEQAQLEQLKAAQVILAKIAKPADLEALNAAADQLTDNRQQVVRSLVSQLLQGQTFLTQQVERIEFEAQQPSGEPA